VSFGPHHYVPVLKLKRGEKMALAMLSPAVASMVTPLFEIVARNEEKGQTVDAHLRTAFDKLDSSMRLCRRCFIDAREIAPEGPAAAVEAFRRASEMGIAFTPVTGISRLEDVAAALSYRTHGVALRLTRREFEDGSITRRLADFMRAHGIAAKEVDLIIDLGAVEDLVAEGIVALTRAFLDEVSDHDCWRTVTVSACAFPASMGVVNRLSHGFVERSEWRAWRDGCHANRSTLRWLPTFSDCAIQHPQGVEGFDFRTMQVSASIRYTTSDSWLLVKGESTRYRPPTEQFPDLATQLVYGHLRQHFAGAGHCSGCAQIKDAADGRPGLGSPEVWRRLGTVHHITTVVEMTAALSWS
jgi:hypothetical protein